MIGFKYGSIFIHREGSILLREIHFHAWIADDIVLDLKYDFLLCLRGASKKKFNQTRNEKINNAAVTPSTAEINFKFRRERCAL